MTKDPLPVFLGATAAITGLSYVSGIDERPRMMSFTMTPDRMDSYYRNTPYKVLNSA